MIKECFSLNIKIYQFELLGTNTMVLVIQAKLFIHYEFYFSSEDEHLVIEVSVRVTRKV